MIPLLPALLPSTTIVLTAGTVLFTAWLVSKGLDHLDRPNRVNECIIQVIKDHPNAPIDEVKKSCEFVNKD